MQRYRPGTALIVVDVQNDFADPAGGLSVAGGEAVIPAIDREIEMAVTNGAIVVATQDWHPASTPHFAKDGGIWPVHCVADSWGAQLHPDLALPDDTPRVRKGANGEDGYSGFTMRDTVSGEIIPTWHSPMTRRGSARAPTAKTATRASRCATPSPARPSPRSSNPSSAMPASTPSS